ncbi:T9SS type A sorting domain-containing protein [Hymenobacter sp. BT491]|uniref:T9SS type A sorting domain-containing protein n=1 Tax=Hymenobacter sp. BT491 TaxID=2766779 RepID=UPI001653B609|nr:T9SS type A sorting domain-containing protein [Hymenobacter sp. BT491]MBC6989192.1 T9SS type A sorting domain-containing protein [Hymenobacter sp. BT491]
MRTLLPSLNRGPVWLRQTSKLLLPLALAFGLQQKAKAQFPRVESFKGNTANGFDFYGNAALTAATGADANGAGYLRLTTANLNLAGTAIDQSTFPAPQGFSISFEFFSYGGTGADGFSVYLIDGSTSTFRIGADGGSLGYAQRTSTTNNVTTTAPGVSNGYIGIGIDEYGNYANGSEGRSGGYVASGTIPDAITIRGAGNGTAATEYPYIASSGTLTGLSLDVTTARAQSGSTDYRRAFIDFIPFTNSSGTPAYRVTVRIQNGNAVTTALSNIEVPPPPPTLRIGFSGSTGGSTNVHEIRNLAIVRPAIANDDRFGTRYGTPVSGNVTSNDQAPGSSLDVATVDLDPTTATVDRTKTVAGQGTFTVDANGLVTFTPLSTFAGVATIPYTIRDILNTLSNQANISVIVTGADLATSVSGPTSANPGSKITYTVSTTNLGVETAINVIPTLTLTPNLPSNSVTLPTGAAYDPLSGIVTFATIASIAPNASPVDNFVTVTVPTTGTALGGVARSTSNSVPDPNSVNNSASVGTSITSSASTVAGCATPGKDGIGNLTSSSVPNTYFKGLNATTGTGGTSISLAPAGAGTIDIAPGDLLLVMQMQGGAIVTANGTTYGGTPTSYTAGLYEYAVAMNSVTAASGGTLQLKSALTNTYSNADYSTTSTTTGQRRFQVIRVPQYSALNIGTATVAATVTGAPWDGSVGGVLAIDVVGKTSFLSTTPSSLNMNGRGYRGGGGRTYTGVTGYADTDYRNIASATTAGAHGAKGEGTIGTPRFVNVNGTSIDTGVEGYLNGSVAQGNPGTGAGGATDGKPTDNSYNTGGGGGGNGGAGGDGGAASIRTANNGGGKYNNFGAGGQGGNAASGATASRLFMGGGGGAGSINTANNNASNGANGGGIIILRTGSVSGTASITANGNSTSDQTDEGVGGGGAGGSVLLFSTTTTSTATTGLGNLTVEADGGAGGIASSSTSAGTILNVSAASYGGGGGGGGGRVYANAGLKTGSSATGGASAGTGSAGTGTTISTTQTATPAGTIAGTTACLPTLTTTLTTSTPNVTRSGNGVNPASYTITISNTGGGASSVSTTATLNSLFRYDNTSAPVVTLTLADGSSTTLAASAYTVSASTTSTPVFSGFTIPGGATLNIDFQATIASTAVNGTAYQASANAVYADPTRTTAARLVSPTTAAATGANTTYENVVATAVPGVNYAATSSTGEDVTIVKPLPVELKQFNATAVRQDGLLTWSTATEVNSDRFEIERSLDGKTFEKIGSVKGQGNSTHATEYRYTDTNAARWSAKPIYYRLRQVDFDGVSAFSPVRFVTFDKQVLTAVALYPNPAHGAATLDLTGLAAGTYQVQVLDLTGRALSKQTVVGAQAHPLSVQQLPMGSYIVRIQGAGTNVTLPLVRN